jgi:hypothetical protein
MGVVKFPRNRCEQFLSFRGQKHDDAVDALVYLILGLVGDGVEEHKIHFIQVLGTLLPAISLQT